MFDRIYTPQGHLEPHPDPARGNGLELRADLLRVVPQHERKPNPDLLRDICRREGVATSDTW